MMAIEQTSKEVASLAGKGFRHPERLTLDEIRKLAASALTQAPDHVIDDCGLDREEVRKVATSE